MDIGDRILKILVIVFLILFILSFIFIFLITEGIRIDRKVDSKTDGLSIVEYEQVYHVFFKQEAFLKITNESDRMIGTLIIREKNSGITSKINKLRVGQTTKLYFSLGNYFEELEFEIDTIRFVEEYK